MLFNIAFKCGNDEMYSDMKTTRIFYWGLGSYSVKAFSVCEPLPFLARLMNKNRFLAPQAARLEPTVPRYRKHAYVHLDRFLRPQTAYADPESLYPNEQSSPILVWLNRPLEHQAIVYGASLGWV